MGMCKKLVRDWVKKITYLESKLGKKVSYEILEPFSVDANCILDIQSAGRRIANFLGLTGYTFIIGKFGLKRNEGGNIELEHHCKDVFIEISDIVAEHEEAVLATLAHEITHKYMHLHKISCGNSQMQQNENEILTDITAVYLGLGKLMINGCKTEKTVRTHNRINKISKTLKLEVGYLKMDELGFVYRLICSMRDISKREMLLNISKEGKAAIKKWSDSKYLSQRFQNKAFKDETICSLRHDIAQLQKSIKESKDILNFFEEEYLKHAKAFLTQREESAAHYKAKLNDEDKDRKPDYVLDFLHAVELNDWVDGAKLGLRNDIASIAQVNKELINLQNAVLKKTLKTRMQTLLNS